MNINNFDQPSFHLALKQIADGAHLYCEGSSFRLGDPEGSALSAEQANLALGFIQAHAHYLESVDREALVRMQLRLSLDVPEEVRERFSLFVQGIYSKEPIQLERKNDSQPPKPPKLVKLGLCIEESQSGDSGAVRTGLDCWLKSGLPVLTTKALISGHNSLPRVSIYEQKEGGLAICLPDSVAIEELGIDLSAFQQVSKEAKTIAFEPFDHERDIRKALLQSENGREIHRLIVAAGHGLPAFFGEAQICGLSVGKFQELLQSLTENGLVFLSLISCFSGGENLTQITLPDGRIPCPVMMFNATDSIAIANLHQLSIATKLLDAAASKLYRPLSKGDVPQQPRSLRQEDLREIGREVFDKQLGQSNELHIQNLQTIFLPTGRGDVPKVVYTGALPETILDVDEEIRMQQRKGLILRPGKVQIEVNNLEVITLFCSAPLLPAVIDVKEKREGFGLLSRGGSSVHFINELKIPAFTLDEFVLSSANKITRYPIGHPARLLGANKLFLIDKLICKDDSGRLYQLYDVAISLTVTRAEVSYADEEGRYYRRNIALDLDQHQLMSFSISTSASALSVGPATEVVNPLDLLFNRFDQYLRCRPSEKYLLMTTAGKLSFSDLCDHLADKLKEGFDQQFVELYRQALEPKKATQLVAMIKALPQDVQSMAADHLLRLAIGADNAAAVAELLGSFGPWMRPLVDGSSALHIAAERGSVAVAKRLLAGINEAGELPDVPDDAGRTPLHYAVIGYPLEIIEILLEQCSELVLDSAELSPLEYALLNNRIEIFCKMLACGKSPIEQPGICQLMVKASGKLSIKIMQAIIESKRIPAGAPWMGDKSFLECFVRQFREAPPQLNESSPQQIQSLELLIAAGFAEAEPLDEQGHHLLMRLLLEGVSFNTEFLNALASYFPLSQAQKELLSEKWLGEMQAHPRRINPLLVMKNLGVLPNPKALWQKILIQVIIDPKVDIFFTKKYIDAGVEIDWKALGAAACSKEAAKNIMQLIEMYHPDLSGDENWKNFYSQYICIEESKEKEAQLLIECGVIPERPIETKDMSSDELFLWVQENPQRFPLFIQTVGAGMKLDPSTAAAKSCLAQFVILHSSLSEWDRSRRTFTRAIQILSKYGVEYDPKHAEVSQERWEKYETTPFKAWKSACCTIPGFLQSDSFVALVEEKIRSGHFTIRKIIQLHKWEIPFDYKLLSDDYLAALLHQEGRLSVIAEVPISGALATRVFAEVLKKEPERWNKTLLYVLGVVYKIEGKELILNQARTALLKKGIGSSSLPSWLKSKWKLLIKLGSSSEIEAELVELFVRGNCVALIEFLIQQDALKADDPALAKLLNEALQRLELARYEKGVRPPAEECLIRYWYNVNDPLEAVIRRDFQPDPASEKARSILEEALLLNDWPIANRLLELGVPFEWTENLAEMYKEVIHDSPHHVSADQVLRQLLAQGMDHSLLYSAVREVVAASLEDKKFGLSRIVHLATLIEKVGPMDWKSPSPAVSSVFSDRFCPFKLSTLAKIGYDLIPHGREIAAWLARAEYGYHNDGALEEKMISLFPSVTESSLLPLWLTDKFVPLHLLRHIEAVGGDRELLKAYIAHRFEDILGNNYSVDDLKFLQRYTDEERWKDPFCTTIIKLSLRGRYLSKAEEMTSFAIKWGDLDGLKAALSERYSLPVLGSIKLLMEHQIPISEQDRKQVREMLIKYDELKLLKPLAELPGTPLAES